jgi:hypothetical protein
MRRMIGRPVFSMSVLLLVASFAIISCRNADSGPGETATQASAVQAQAGVAHLQQVTLRITGMS